MFIYWNIVYVWVLIWLPNSNPILYSHPMNTSSLTVQYYNKYDINFFKFFD